jgi:hypothetical protein
MSAIPTEHNWCVLEFARNNSLVAVQRAFRRKFGCRGSPASSIQSGMNNFATEATSVIKGRATQEDQALPKRPSRECVKVLFGALEICV